MLRLLLPLLLSAAPAPAERDVVLFLGDSLTAGYGVALEEAYPALIEERWRRDKLPLRARNAGVSGITTAGVLENLDWSLADDVRAVFLAVGANDGLRGLDLRETERNLARIIAEAQKRGIRVFLAGMKIPPNYGPEYAGRFEGMYPRLARRYKLKLLPFLLEGVAGLRRYNIEDGVHPNAEGHRLMADAVDRFLRKELLR